VLIVPSRVLLTLFLAVVIFPFTLASSLASRTIRYATWVSLGAYVVWLASVAFAHAHGTLAPNPQWTQLGPLWHGVGAYPSLDHARLITTPANVPSCAVPILFTFTSSWTLPLYAALKASSPRHTAVKSSRRYSFQTLTAASTALAVLLVLPLCFFSAHPNAPVRASAPSASVATDALGQDTPRHPPHALIAAANALTLALAVPLLLLTAPALPIPAAIRRATPVPLSKLALFALALALALLPAPVPALLSDVLLVLAVASTFVLPGTPPLLASLCPHPN
jgi:hypothetical protein